jgi:hypothetical protein
VGLPAFAEGRYFDVLAANSLARALSPNLQAGQNRLHAVFPGPAEKALYPDWEHATARLAAGFRESAGTDADDPRFGQLAGELSLSSERFRRLWARHDVQSREGMPARIHHPQAGDLTLSREKLTISGAQGQLLVIYHAQPGTSSAEKLGLLASLASPTATVARYGRPRRNLGRDPTATRQRRDLTPPRHGVECRSGEAWAQRFWLGKKSALWT